MQTLIFDVNRGFRVWLIDQIYLGPTSPTSGRIVPNVDDAVFDWNRGVFRVVAVDNVFTVGNGEPTYTPTLKLVDLSILAKKQMGLIGSQNLISYQPNVLELAFLNTLVTPFTISLDDRYRVFDTEAAYIKLFKGTDVSANKGTVISKVFNGSGNYISENVELELIDPNNPAIKRPPVFNTIASLYDGEVVTAVIYTQAGGPIGQHSFLIKNSSAIRGLGNNTVFITDIILVSEMLDNIELDLINVPANLPITGGDFQARLLYSDGSNSLISVGTTKCKLHGITNFNTSLAGVSSTVVLNYYPDVNEPIINTSNPYLRSLTHSYRIRTSENVLDKSFKIYVVPVFNTVTNKYTNTYYLTNLNYDILIKLNNSQISVRNLDNTPIDYTTNTESQTLLLSVVMSTVFPIGYTGYTFVQSVIVRYGSETTFGWILDYKGNNENVYGAEAYFEYSITGQQVIQIKSGAVTIEEWLSILWTPLHAIFNHNLSLSAPTPTHIQLRYKGVSSPIKAISVAWNSNIPNEFGVAWTEYSTVEVVWLAPTLHPDVYLTVGISPVMIKNTLV
jgi:hypothetical protein